MRKKLLMACLLFLPLAAITAEGTAPKGYEYWNNAAFADVSKGLAEKSTSDPYHSASKQVTDYSNDYFLVAHREADGQVEWHESQTDVFVVRSGSATLVVGGTNTGGKTTTPGEMRGGTIEGGTRQKLSAGDVVRIPAKAPHQLLVSSGEKFDYFVVKIKGY
jgi:mannose-6-phosphate isomerase-like protein (cupin superfamily)